METPGKGFSSTDESGQDVRRSRGPSWRVLVLSWLAVFVIVWQFVRSNGPAPLHDVDAVARATTPPGTLLPGEQARINVFRKAAPAVVFIYTLDVGRIGLNLVEVPRGTGTGIVYDLDGHIITNFHVLNEGRRWKVVLSDESEWDAELVGIEPDKDLAVLKIKAPADRLTAIDVGGSSDLRVGQSVLAIGNPFGFDHTLTVGVVSAIGREIQSLTGRKIRGAIQTDAAINPGNSGGPLLDTSGRLIGVCTQIASPSGASAGIGFAVPVDIVNEVVPELIRFGAVRRLGLGVRVFDERQVRWLRLPGLLIDSVTDGAGAAVAGMRGTSLTRGGYIRQMGDIVTEVDGRKVLTLNDLKDVLEGHQPKDVVDVSVVREDEVLVLKVKLDYINIK